MTVNNPTSTKSTQRKKSRKTPYQGGAWSVGGVRLQRPKVAPAERRQQLLRYCEHAQQRIDEGVTIYEGILQQYRVELITVSIEMAAERTAAANVPPVAKAA